MREPFRTGTGKLSGFVGRYVSKIQRYKHQSALHESPVFDGSETSFGSTGEFFAHNGSLVGNRTVWLPPGKGGGCIKDGSFVG